MTAAAASPVSRETIYAEVRLNQQLRRLEQESIVSWPLAIGFMVGIFVVLAGAPSMLIVGSYMNVSSQKEKSRQASFSVEKEMEKQKKLTPEEEEQLLKLGIDDGTEKSTMTWIGYKDYQEQLARKSEVEQAAFKENDAGGQPAQAQPNQPASPPSQAQQQARAQPPTPPPTAQTPPPQPPAQQPAQPTALAQAETPPTPPAPSETAPPVQAPDTTKAVAPPPMPVSLALPETPKVANPAQLVPLADERKIETQVLPVERVGDAKDDKVPPDPLKMPPPDSPPTNEKPNELKPNDAKATDAKPVDEKQPDKPADVKPPDEKPLEATKPQVKPPEKTLDATSAPANPTAQPPTPQQPAVAAAPPSPPQQQAAASPPANPSQQTPATQAGTAPGKPSDGEKSDRESDATSIVDVPQSKWRNGRPLAGKGLNVRTQRPVFDELTTISTAGSNPIVEIEFDKEGVPKLCTIVLSSGSQLIDQPIIDCLYRWRASGSQLANLPEGKTLKYRIRMLLTK